MKKIFIFTFLSFAFSSAFSQNFDVLKKDKITVVSNDTITVSSPKVNSYFSEIFYIKNNTSTDNSLKILFERISLVHGASYAYCWDQCYSNPANNHLSGNVAVVAGTVSTTSLSSDYTPDGNYGTSVFKYSFICDALGDTTYVVVRFVIDKNATAINQVQNKKVLIYPNPCNDFFRLENLSENKIESLELFNILGNEVKIGYNNPKLLFDTQSLSNGLYLLKINYTNGLKEVYRLIVNH